jgi:hypothetical protein
LRVADSEDVGRQGAEQHAGHSDENGRPDRHGSCVRAQSDKRWVRRSCRRRE